MKMRNVFTKATCMVLWDRDTSYESWHGYRLSRYPMQREAIHETKPKNDSANEANHEKAEAAKKRSRHKPQTYKLEAQAAKTKTYK